MRLVEGAHAIRNDLPTSSTVLVDVPLEAGDDQGSGVARLSSLLLVRDAQARELELLESTAITIGGDCGVELAAVEHISGRDAAVLWFDAHADLNTPQSSPSGAFSGMVLRTLLGDGPTGLAPATAISPDRLILVGTRALDDAEADYIADTGITTIPADTLTPELLVAAVRATGATTVYVHIDLDVLDPSDFAAVGTPEPFGPSATTVAQSIRLVRESFPLAGAGITSFAPATESQASDDLPTILRLLGALTR